jgi:uncharacterized protein
VSATEPARLPTLPSLVVGRVIHRRRGPIRHEFRHRAYQWLVDLDSLPGRRADRRFRSADHLGDPRLTIKANVKNFLARNAILLGDGGRVLMLAQCRVLGHVFNPLSIFWCYDSEARLAAVVAEVHNTYGERHAYLLHPDETGTAVTGKDFHVSPFYGVDGTYELRFTLRDDRVCTSVTLRHDGDVAFVAAFRGRPEPATARAIRRMHICQPLMPQRVSTLIRVHGIWLWLRGLPAQPQSPRMHQAGV